MDETCGQILDEEAPILLKEGVKWQTVAKMVYFHSFVFLFLKLLIFLFPSLFH